MTRDDILKMAREADGLPDPMVFIGAYERFFHAAYAAGAAAEREACAKAVEVFDKTFQTGGGISGTIRRSGKNEHRRNYPHRAGPRPA